MTAAVPRGSSASRAGRPVPLTEVIREHHLAVQRLAGLVVLPLKEHVQRARDKYRRRTGRDDVYQEMQERMDDHQQRHISQIRAAESAAAAMARPPGAATRFV